MYFTVSHNSPTEHLSKRLATGLQWHAVGLQHHRYKPSLTREKRGEGGVERLRLKIYEILNISSVKAKATADSE